MHPKAATVRRSAVHPTRAKLLTTVIELLDEHLPEELSSDMVLKHSGISRGSLYHHFEDFADLMESALTGLFAQAVDENIAMMRGLIDNANSRADVLAGIEKFNRHTQSPENRDQRFSRVRLLGLAYRNPRLTAKLAAEQDRLTQAYADLFRLAQQNGWMTDDFDPQAAAVLIQAYTLGRVVDDVSTRQVDADAWNSLIMRIVTRVFGATG